MSPYRKPPERAPGHVSVVKVLLAATWLLVVAGVVAWATWPDGPMVCGVFVAGGLALVLTSASLRVLFGDRTR